MTTEPIEMEGPFPNNSTCPLHVRALEEIKVIVLDTRRQVIELKEIGGPLVAHEKLIEKAVSEARRAHERIDTVDTEVEQIKKAQTKMLVRIGAVMAPISAAIGGLIGAIVAGMR